MGAIRKNYRQVIANKHVKYLVVYNITVPPLDQLFEMVRTKVGPRFDI